MKKDLKPIWLYLGIYIGIQFIIGFIIGIIYVNNAIEMVNKLSTVITFISYLAVTITFICIYQKQLKGKIKEMTKKNFIYAFVGAVILILVNVILYKLFTAMNVKMENQEAIIDAYKNSKALMLISVILFAPFVEEMVFRYSLSTFIKNDTIFVIISSLIFGLMHGIGVASIIYIALGVVLSLIYLKTNKNVIASTIAHILNNAFAMITMLIMIRF